MKISVRISGAIAFAGIVAESETLGAKRHKRLQCRSCKLLEGADRRKSGIYSEQC